MSFRDTMQPLLGLSGQSALPKAWSPILLLPAHIRPRSPNAQCGVARVWCPPCFRGVPDPHPIALHFLSLLLGHLCNQSSKPGASWRWKQEGLGSRLDAGRLAFLSGTHLIRTVEFTGFLIHRHGQLAAYFFQSICTNLGERSRDFSTPKM